MVDFYHDTCCEVHSKSQYEFNLYDIISTSNKLKSETCACDFTQAREYPMPSQRIYHIFEVIYICTRNNKTNKYK